MTEREVIWLGIGVLIGYLIWEEFAPPRKGASGSSVSAAGGSSTQTGNKKKGGCGCGGSK